MLRSPLNMRTTTPHDPATGQIPPPKLRRLARDVAHDLWRALVPLVVFEVAFKSVAFLVGAIGAGWVIQPLIVRTGKLAVTNTEIARFLLSPSGLLYLILIALSLMVGTMIEHVGVIAIAAAHLRGGCTTLSGTLSDLAAMFFRLLLFGLRSLATLVVLCAPFVVLVGVGYLILLSRQDINYYLANRPPRWYLALGIGGILLAILAARLAMIYVDTIFVVPILLFGDRRGRAAIEESRACRRRTTPDWWGPPGLAGRRVAPERGGRLGLRTSLRQPDGNGGVPADCSGPPCGGSTGLPGTPRCDLIFRSGRDPLPVDPPTVSRTGRYVGHLVSSRTLGDRHAGHENRGRGGATPATTHSRESGDRDRPARFRRLSGFQHPQQNRRRCPDRGRGSSRRRATCTGEHAQCVSQGDRGRSRLRRARRTGDG